MKQFEKQDSYLPCSGCNQNCPHTKKEWACLWITVFVTQTKSMVRTGMKQPLALGPTAQEPVWAMAAPMGLPPVSRHTESHPCRIPTAFFVKYDAQLFTFDTNFFFLPFAFHSHQDCTEWWLTYFCRNVGFACNYSNYSALITGFVPRMSGFFVLLLLPRLHSVGASGKSANDGGAGALEMH